ncbi:diaminopimelate decarboxylase [Dethiothermospora halolimnae]|uniref:diaminopimelate decarboxylase n=1 Tax=Dethiothermospora halolimnae TaxID=3114390 RepID=UPI003CCBDB88
MKLFGTMEINNKGHLKIGGCDVVDLTNKYGTPAYVVDEDLVRERCKLFKSNFSYKKMDTEVIYASKAFLNIAMCQLVKEEGLSLDVVSGGELYTAIKADFPVEKIYMHGNNKTIEELTMAIEAGVGRIIVDNRQELELIESLCESLNSKVDVLLRVNPGIEAHTHEYIKTTKNDSKFGESIFSEEIYKIINRINNSSHMEFKGLHSHIGSQIFQEKSFYEQSEVMLKFVKKIKEKCDVRVKELNLGGGFGIYYSEGDTPMKLNEFLKNMLENIEDKAKELSITVPKIMIEPGRSIVANGGTTLYRVGGTKKTYGGKHYIFVDGGMNDNPRTALYGAQYEAAIANRMTESHEDIYTISGKCCESGDMIVKDINLPHPNVNDVVAVFSTGAYNYSMSSNYNRLPRPPVIFVKDKESRCVVKRETYEDLIKNDLAI